MGFATTLVRELFLALLLPLLSRGGGLGAGSLAFFLDGGLTIRKVMCPAPRDGHRAVEILVDVLRFFLEPDGRTLAGMAGAGVEEEL
jgi:hypothetical protein